MYILNIHKRQHVAGNTFFVQCSVYIIMDKFGFKPWKMNTKVVLRVPLILKYNSNQCENSLGPIYSIISLNIASDLSVPSLLAFDCFKSCSKQHCGYRLQDLVVPEGISHDFYPWMVVSFCQ